MASFRYQLFRLAFSLVPGGGTRTKLIKKSKVFESIGNNVLWQPRKLPSDPKRIKFHNNIQVASGVVFVNHDIIGYMLNRYDKSFEFKNTVGCIEVLDNVAIGANSIIMPNVRIGANVIVGAGSIVTKDIPDGVVVAGVPAKVIGNFNEFVDKRKNYTLLTKNITTNNELWKDFYQQRLD